jgi:hypothetical protein
MSPLQRQARTFVRRPKRWVPAVLAALAIGLATFFALRSLLEVEPDTPERQPPELPEP